MHNCLLLRDKELAICSPNFVQVDIGDVNLNLTMLMHRHNIKCQYYLGIFELFENVEKSIQQNFDIQYLKYKDK